MVQGTCLFAEKPYFVEGTNHDNNPTESSHKNDVLWTKKWPIFCLLETKKRTFDLKGRCKELPFPKKIVEVYFPTDSKDMGFNIFIFTCLDEKDSFVPARHFKVRWARRFKWSFSILFRPCILALELYLARVFHNNILLNPSQSSNGLALLALLLRKFSSSGRLGNHSLQGDGNLTRAHALPSQETNTRHGDEENPSMVYTYLNINLRGFESAIAGFQSIIKSKELNKRVQPPA